MEYRTSFNATTIQGVRDTQSVITVTTVWLERAPLANLLCL